MFELGETVLVLAIRVCAAIRTIGLLEELDIQTLYNRNTRRRAIKVYAGIATLAFAREHSAKAKNDVTDTSGTEHAPSHEPGVCVSAVPIAAWKLSIYIRT